MDPVVKELATKNAILEAGAKAGMIPGLIPAAHALLTQQLGDRIEVTEVGAGQHKVEVVTDAGRTSMADFVREWAKTPEGRVTLHTPAFGEPEPGVNEAPFTPKFMFQRALDVIAVRDDAMAERVRTAADAYEGVLTALQARIREVQRVFRSQVQARELAKAAEDAASKIAAAQAAQLGPVTKAVERLEAELLTPGFRLAIPSGANPDDWRQAEAEGRAHVRSAIDPLSGQPDKLVARELYLSAAQRGDRQGMRTFELAPSVAPLVGPEDIAEGAELFAAAVVPEKWARLVEARAVRDVVSGDGARAIQELRGIAGHAYQMPVAPAEE